MKDEYDFSKAKKRSDRVKSDPSAAKLPISIRLDGGVIAWFKTESARLGIPYQTLMASALHRFATGELIDKEDLAKFKGA